LDFIGELIDKRSKRAAAKQQSSSTNTNKNSFFNYQCILVTSHHNGTARTIKHQQISYPFRIPLGLNLPPTCDFKDYFSIQYYVEVFHDGHLLPNIHRLITLAPPNPLVVCPSPVQVNGQNDVTLICGLNKSHFNGRQSSIVPITVHIQNPKQKQIKSLTAQLMQLVQWNGAKRETEIFTALLNEIPENNKQTQMTTNCELILPNNLSPTFVPNENAQSDSNGPIIQIQYEFRITAQMKGATTPNIKLTLPIGIE